MANMGQSSCFKVVLILGTAVDLLQQLITKAAKIPIYAYTIRDWVKSINDAGSPGGNFAVSYNYTNNGNVDIANFHNPQVQSGGGPATRQWAFGYDANLIHCPFNAERFRLSEG